MAESFAHGSLSFAEYRELEEASSVRHEYVGGEVYAMTGATRRHHRVCGNIFRRLSDAADGTPCRVSMESVRLEVSGEVVPGGVAYYPDVMVVCEPEPEDPYIEVAPCLVAEVLSPSSLSTDRREKLLVYRNLPSMRAYLVVDPERRRVERHFRDEGGGWRRADLTGEGRFPVPCPTGAELTLAGIFDGL